MNYGRCPYDDCKGLLWEAIPDAPLPAFAKVQCEDCERPVWYKFSRLDPEAFTPAEFEALYIVDDETKSCRLRNPPPEPSEEAKRIANELAKALIDELDRQGFFGTLSSVAFIPLPPYTAKDFHDHLMGKHASRRVAGCGCPSKKWVWPFWSL